MGNLCGPSDAAGKRTNQINKMMKKDKIDDAGKLKLLLLGAGESGKSTLFKQMKLLYSDSRRFSDEEKRSYQLALYKNIFHDFSILLPSFQTHSPLKTEEGVRAAKELNLLFTEISQTKKANVTIDEGNYTLFRDIWADPGTQETWENRGDLQVQDSLEYFMLPDNLKRISQPGYVPTNNDILRTRVRTSGIVQEKFVLQEARFEMYDVGGQKNERKKWKEAFDGVTSVIFVAAISEYNQMMFEEGEKSRQEDSVQLFKEQLHEKYWVNTPFILFLNKTDLFREKLPKVPFRVADGEHPRNVDFEGPHCEEGKIYTTDGTDREYEERYNAACNYLQALYEAQNMGNSQRAAPIYTKFTNSTDTDQMESIMTTCKEIILRGNLLVGGWMNPEEEVTQVPSNF